MKYNYFYEVFDRFFYLTLDDVNEITGVKKIYFEGKFTISFCCAKELENTVKMTFEDIFIHISPKLINNYSFGYSKKEFNSYLIIVVVFYLAKINF